MSERVERPGWTPVEGAERDRLLADANPKISPGDGPREAGFAWGLDDALWMSLRFQVPVVPIEARGHWEPSRQAMVVPLPGGARLPLLVSAEGYAWFVYLLHWIIWPLFLYGATAGLFRSRSESS